MSSYVVEAVGPNGFGCYRVRWEGNQPEFEPVSQAPEALLVPGFIDLHLHGGFGIDLMSDDASYEELCRRLAREGYEGFLPTTVTASVAEVERFIQRMPEHPMVLGFHLEGPFISPRYPGAQPPGWIVDPPVGNSEWDSVLEDPRLRIVTLAPERPHALELILRLQKRGVIVSMGHTDATYEEARRGFEFGAVHATHTFNAMRPFHHREAGVVGYALLARGLRCELIYDRKHVCREAAEVLLENKKLEEVIGVSDSSMATGLPAGQEIEMWGHKCITGQGEVRLAESGALAGSAVTLREVFLNLWEDFGPEWSARACCWNPRRVLGLSAQPRVWLEFGRDRELRNLISAI